MAFYYFFLNFFQNFPFFFNCLFICLLRSFFFLSSFPNIKVLVQKMIFFQSNEVLWPTKLTGSNFLDWSAVCEINPTSLLSLWSNLLSTNSMTRRNLTWLKHFPGKSNAVNYKYFLNLKWRKFGFDTIKVCLF